MATEALLSRYLPASDDERQQAVAPKKRGLFLRIVDVLIEARQRAADREIARFIELRGGKLTDELDRQISRDRF